MSVGSLALGMGNAGAKGGNLVDTGTVVKVSTAVLASQAEISTPLAGIPLEVDAVTGQKVPNSPAIMGFVGANTDAAYLLLRVGTRIGGEIGDRYRLIGTRIMDSFVTVGLSPPQGEGFDLSTGHIATYRKVRGRPTVFLRSDPTVVPSPQSVAARISYRASPQQLA